MTAVAAGDMTQAVTYAQVDECNSNRVRVMAEAAESSTAVKVLVVRVRL